jgi:hypothetical protein
MFRLVIQVICFAGGGLLVFFLSFFKPAPTSVVTFFHFFAPFGGLLIKERVPNFPLIAPRVINNFQAFIFYLSVLFFGANGLNFRMLLARISRLMFCRVIVVRCAFNLSVQGKVFSMECMFCRLFVIE